MMELASIDPFALQAMENPYPLYERLRREAPVEWSARNAWLVTRHADVGNLLTDERLSHWVLQGPPGGAQSEMARILARWLELMHPRHRSRLRSLTQRVFSPGNIRNLTDRLEHLAESLLRNVDDGREIDLVRSYAVPFSLGAIGELLGIPPQHQERFQRFAGAAVNHLFQLIGFNRSQSSGDEVAKLFLQFLLACLAEKEKQPGNDLMSALFVAQESGDALDRDDFLALSIVFLFAGYENTKNLISSSVLTLLRHPDQLAHLRKEPALFPLAVEELLRYESPVHLVSLRAEVDVEVRGKEIRAGQQVLLSLASANRDPDVFAEPDRLDLGRRDNPHLGFGHGPFFCIGAPLARLEAQVALRALLRRFSSLELPEGPLVWRSSSPVLRGLQRLPIVGHSERGTEAFHG